MENWLPGGGRHSEATRMSTESKAKLQGTDHSTSIPRTAVGGQMRVLVHSSTCGLPEVSRTPEMTRTFQKTYAQHQVAGKPGGGWGPQTHDPGDQMGGREPLRGRESRQALAGVCGPGRATALGVICSSAGSTATCTTGQKEHGRSVRTAQTACAPLQGARLVLLCSSVAVPWRALSAAWLLSWLSG